MKSQAKNAYAVNLPVFPWHEPAFYFFLQKSVLYVKQVTINRYGVSFRLQPSHGCFSSKRLMKSNQLLHNENKKVDSYSVNHRHASVIIRLRKLTSKL